MASDPSRIEGGAAARRWTGGAWRHPPGCIVDLMDIRSATADDAAAIGRMHLASWREAYSELLPQAFWDRASEARWIERWRRNLVEPPDATSTWIAIHDDRVIGLATAGPSLPNPTAGAPVRDRELWVLYVRASEYGAGLAGRLLDAVLSPGPAQLWVLEANPRAIAFYAKHGFAPDGARHVLGPELGHQPEIRLIR